MGGGRGARPRPLGVPARIVLSGLLLLGAVVAAPSGIGLVWFVPYAGVGTVLAVRRPDTSIGWLLLTLSWLIVAVLGIIDATPAQFEDGSLSPLTAFLAIAQAISGAGLFYALAILAIVFPSGRLPAGRWGAVTRLCLVVGGALLGASIVMPRIAVSFAGSSVGIGVRNPVAILPELAIWQLATPDTLIIPFVALLLASVTSLFVRYRRAIGVERQQLRWITAALGLVILGVLAGFVASAIIPAANESGLAWIGPIIAVPCVPLAIGVAVLRYRLYEIDRIISRTVSYAIVTLLLAGLFGGAILALQAVLAPFTAGNGLAVAASTLVVAVTFQPLRTRVQRIVDRRFDRARYDGERLAVAFADRLRDEVELEPLRSDLLSTVGGALQPRLAAVWLRGPAERS